MFLPFFNQYDETKTEWFCVCISNIKYLPISVFWSISGQYLKKNAGWTVQSMHAILAGKNKRLLEVKIAKLSSEKLLS